MHKPIVITVEHHATKQEVVRKLKSSFGDIRTQIAPYVSSVTEDWRDNGVEVRLVALAHPITSSIEVDERLVRIEVRLPGVLGIFGGLIASRVKCGASLLIEPPRS
jgi:Putative polyhydroxyalkanoic acid system protein (PHA_gran_rgn)